MSSIKEDEWPVDMYLRVHNADNWFNVIPCRVSSDAKRFSMMLEIL